jgi:NhaP-type Na+/H+ or K+/H+ antiporter
VPNPDPKGVFIVGWTGMRGVVSLAAALSLPYTLSNGEPFAQRNLILFLTFSIIFVTLVVQGLSLPPIIRALGLTGSHEEEHEELTARRILIRSALASLQERLRGATGEDHHDIEDLMHFYEHRLEATEAPSGALSVNAANHSQRQQLQLGAVAAERSALLDLRDRSLVSDDVLRRLERELDLDETRFSDRS